MGVGRVTFEQAVLDPSLDERLQLVDLDVGRHHVPGDGPVAAQERLRRRRQSLGQEGEHPHQQVVDLGQRSHRCLVRGGIRWGRGQAGHGRDHHRPTYEGSLVGNQRGNAVNKPAATVDVAARSPALHRRFSWRPADRQIGATRQTQGRRRNSLSWPRPG